MNKEFTEEENRWYIANLYIYMNYHPTNEAKLQRTLINNFIEGEFAAA